jgi:hypothetical protein
MRKVLGLLYNTGTDPSGTAGVAESRQKEHRICKKASLFMGCFTCDIL